VEVEMTVLSGAFLLTWLTACEPIPPCEDYVDYMCACHEEDTGVDCEDLQDTYSGAAPAVQDECGVLLNEQQSEDEQAGETCAG
jgi:hypothetical protein